MRVIHISPTAFGADGLFGGGERYPTELARALARKVDCKLVTFGPRASSYRDGDLEVTVLARAVLLKGHPAHPVARGIRRELAGADIVHAHHVRAFPSRFAAFIASLSRGPCVVTDHGLGPSRWTAVDKRLFDRFLTVSRYSARTLGSPPSDTTVIYGGADTTRFHPNDEERSGALFVGRITPHKGIDRLIEALPAGATLTLAGTAGHDRRAPERDYPEVIKGLIATRDVRFVGRVEEEELPALYRRARVFVLPSVHTTYYGKHVAIPELLGLSLLEAMASGTPVIASNVGGLPEVVVHGETGFVVEAGDVKELHARLEEVLGDDRLFAQMSASAREHVVANFTWDRCAERCLSVYEELSGAE